MFDNFDISKMTQALNDAQEQAKKLQEQNASREFSVKTGGGLVQVRVNGNSEVLDISIDDSLLEDKESMQILLISAINDAMKMVEENKKQLAAQMLGNFANFGG